MQKTCIACGMPMTKPEDYPLQDQSKAYCLHCAKQDGSMQSYEEKLRGMTDFMVRTQGIDEAAALETVKQLLSTLPAWKDA